MVLMLDRIIGLFRKKNDGKHEEEFQKDYMALKYTGNEPICMACSYPIYESQRSRKMNGRLMHIKCFRKISKMVSNRGKVNGF